jgi:hypothetical protein
MSGKQLLANFTGRQFNAQPTTLSAPNSFICTVRDGNVNTDIRNIRIRIQIYRGSKADTSESDFH